MVSAGNRGTSPMPSKRKGLEEGKREYEAAEGQVKEVQVDNNGERERVKTVTNVN